MSSTASRKKKHRESPDPNLPRWVQRCSNSKRFRLKVPGVWGFDGVRKHGIDFSVNFGTYPTATAADKVGKKVRERLVRGMSIWDALSELLQSGEVPENITARWIFEVDGGWAARGRSMGREVLLEGPFPSPEVARKAISAAVPIPKRWGRAIKALALIPS